MLINFVPRAAPSRAMQYASPLLAVALMMVLGFILCIAVGRNPLTTFYVFTISPVSTLYGFGELLIKAAPLVLIAMGLAIGFQSNIWNIGAEGQLTMGAICAGGLALHYASGDNGFALPAMIVAGAGGGMLWAAIPAFLRRASTPAKFSSA
jgi:ABC-type uncharacterized transport system permease subunit